jgi:lauroyl/myristoyl acyltransferase
VKLKSSNPQTAEIPSRFREVQHTPLMRSLVRGFVRAAGFLPVWLMRLLAVSLVLPIAIPLTGKNLRGIMANMARMDPGSSGSRRFLNAAAVYKNYSYYLIDLLYLSHDKMRVKEYRTTVTGGENLYKALNLGKGVVLLTSHLGNWEMGGEVIGDTGRKIHLVYAPDSSAIFERQRDLLRGGTSVEGVALKPGDLASLKLYRLLTQGELVALQGDRLQFDRGISVPFFGSPATFPQGAVRLAQLSGSPVVPIFIPLKGYKNYEIIIGEPLIMEPDQRVEENLARLLTVFERQIGRFKTQWYMFMPFWDIDRERLHNDT